MLEASWSGRFAGIERFSEPESGEKSNAFPRFFEQVRSQTNLLTKMFNDVHRFLDFVAVAFETCFDLISSFIFCVHSSRPGVESSRLAQSFRKRGPISNVISTKSSTVLTCTYSILQYSEFLPVFFPFCFHASLVSAPCQTCLRSKRGSRPLLMCQFMSVQISQAFQTTIKHSDSFFSLCRKRKQCIRRF